MESERRGDWQVFVDVGAKILPSGCGPCIGLGDGLLEDNEVGISATNRNFKGRMGSRNAVAYLASPAVVAASAVNGYISSPSEWKLDNNNVNGSSQRGPLGVIKQDGDSSSNTNSNNTSNSSGSNAEVVPLAEGFPKAIEGQLVFCYQDNLNTDGIYPGKYTYKEDITPQQQAQVVMENYDPQFSNIVKEGDILVGGFNFGTGSSREQAATALKYKGIPLVLAGSFSETFKRNALNNGYLVIEVPKLVTHLKQRFQSSSQPTLLTGISVKVDFEKSVVQYDGQTYTISPIGTVAQELILSGGLESWVSTKIRNQQQS